MVDDDDVADVQKQWGPPRGRVHVPSQFDGQQQWNLPEELSPRDLGDGRDVGVIGEEKEGQLVEVPRVELVVQRSGEHDSDEVGSEEGVDGVDGASGWGDSAREEHADTRGKTV